MQDPSFRVVERRLDVAARQLDAVRAATDGLTDALAEVGGALQRLAHAPAAPAHSASAEGGGGMGGPAFGPATPEKPKFSRPGA